MGGCKIAVLSYGFAGENGSIELDGSTGQASQMRERLMPPSALDLLLRVTFPSSSAHVKAAKRLEAMYPTLKEVALAGSPGSKAMKQVS
nr:transmembrane protein 214-like [Tanacetum cinerariifolium]